VAGRGTYPRSRVTVIGLIDVRLNDIQPKLRRRSR
jgi:hypothetical protein